MHIVSRSVVPQNSSVSTFLFYGKAKSFEENFCFISKYPYFPEGYEVFEK